MSGGVDSSVAAARLLDQGYDVVGVTLHLWDYPDDPDAIGGHGRCCAPEDQYDAKRVADQLGFPHYTFDRRKLFAAQVVEPFVQAYLEGATPSPCSSCNRTVKMFELFGIANTLGAEFVATGHYARVGTSPSGSPALFRGTDASKDQSYFLYTLGEAELKRMLFPLGESSKEEVRAEAVARNLAGATKGESQELCFVGAGHSAYIGFVEERAKGKVRPGRILNNAGETLGHHDGIHRFTIGQRKGLSIAAGEPLFVQQIDPVHNAIVVGKEDSLYSTSTPLEDYVAAPGENAVQFSASARIRYRHAGVPVDAERNGNTTTLRFREPAKAVTRGQIAVLYDGDRVLGGGRIP